jgi:hypothetical protein
MHNHRRFGTTLTTQGPGVPLATKTMECGCSVSIVRLPSGRQVINRVHACGRRDPLPMVGLIRRHTVDALN